MPPSNYYCHHTDIFPAFFMPNIFNRNGMISILSFVFYFFFIKYYFLNFPTGIIKYFYV